MSAMKMTRYVCSHCGRNFEAEEKEIMECPGCFWSSSVKKQEDAEESVSQKPVLSKKVSVPFDFSFAFPFVILIVLAGGLFFAWPHLQSLRLNSLHVKTPHLSLKTSESIAKPKEKSKTQTAPPTAQAVPSAASITEEDKNILSRRVQLTADRPLAEQEQKILSRRVPFKSGSIEKLPSQEWTLESFKKLVADQERVYRVPLPKSYKNKLEALFKAKYLPAVEAFKNGDELQARNLWVDSLAFPIYANDVRKHRGVVLTMIRPFINDTLSKIGAVNTMLVERKIRDKEKNAVGDYEKLLKAIEAKSWKEGSEIASGLQKRLAEFSNPDQLGGAPDSYPDSIHQVDEGIQQTLGGLLGGPPPAIADLEPIREDVYAKKKVVDGFIVENLNAAQAKYNEALDLIANKSWAEAIDKLRTLETPMALAEDAQAKIRILKKMNEASSSSGGQTGAPAGNTGRR